MSTQPKKASAADVSRALTDAGVTKSTRSNTRIKGIRKDTRGFIAKGQTRYDATAGRYVQTGTVTVHWATGNLMPFAGGNERQATQLAKCSEILTAKGYTVQASDNGTTLTVTRKSHDMTVDGSGRVSCTCGEASSRLGTVAIQKQWQANHRREVREANRTS